MKATNENLMCIRLVVKSGSPRRCFKRAHGRFLEPLFSYNHGMDGFCIVVIKNRGDRDAAKCAKWFNECKSFPLPAGALLLYSYINDYDIPTINEEEL